MSTVKSIVIEPVARQYFLSHLYDKDPQGNLTKMNFDFPDLVRTSKMVKGVEVITYEKSKVRNLRKVFNACLPARIIGNATFGQVAASSLREDLIALKLAKGNKTIKAKENWKRVANKIAPIGKGMSELERRQVKGCMVDSTYWHEVLSDMHVGPEFGNHLYKQWERRSKSPLSFHEWIKDGGNRQSVVDIFIGRPELASSETFVHPTTKRVLKKVDENKLCVIYLDEAQRQAYRVKVKNKMLINAQDLPLDTAGYQSMGRYGRAIFVMDPSGQLFAGSHIVNHFHHSSFLSGGAVLGAGEIETDDQGNLVRITNKSGHYKPTAENMLDVLRELDKDGIDLTHVEVKILKGPGNASFIYKSAKEFLESGGKVLPGIIERPDEEEAFSFKQELQRFQDKGMDLSQIQVSIPSGLAGRKIVNASEHLAGKV